MKQDPAMSFKDEPTSDDEDRLEIILDDLQMDFKAEAEQFSELPAKIDFQCRTCAKSFKRKIDLIHHQKIHENTFYECTKCHHKYKIKGYLHKHKCRLCSRCGATFTTLDQLRSHMKQIHNENCSKRFECDFCGKIYDARFGLVWHINMHHIQTEARDFHCDLCASRFKFKEQIKKHMRIHLSRVPCRLCGKMIQRTNYFHHMNFVHVYVRNYSCTVCGLSYKTKQCLRSHVRRHEKAFECPTCGKKFSQKVLYSQHMQWHANSKAFSCAVCNKECSSKVTLRQHRKVHEDGIERFSCKICSYRTENKENLTKHERRHARREEKVAMKKNWLKCERCPVLFKNKLKLATHMWRKHNDENE
jgi:KRAB domain-containing zinc finger protein